LAHQLDFIKREDVLKAIQKIDSGIVTKDNEWSEYWISQHGKYYQFKYVVEVASSFTKTPIKTTDFTSNDSSRKYVSNLGFHILYKSPDSTNTQINYWVGASYFGPSGNFINMFDDFIKNKYWGTDHNLHEGEGLKVYSELQKVQINDRLCIRYFNKKGSTVHIAAIGTVSDTSQIHDGRLGVKWDYNSPEYRGLKPSGTGSGNWWKTFFQLKKHTDIALIFGKPLIEKRIARISWNLNGWVMPSGPIGKSRQKDSHEALYGYGHEEWLFDTNKLINGYHYGFLEPIRKEQQAYTGNTYNVWLYSIDGVSKKRFWIGQIKNLIVIDKEEAEAAKKNYVEKRWFDEMIDQIKSSGANKGGFSNFKGVDLFNIKFKPNDIQVNDPYYELPDNHPIHEQSRYSFAHYKDQFEIQNDFSEDNFAFTPSSDDDEDDKDPETKVHQRHPKAVEIVYLHRAISDSLTKALKQSYGKRNVRREHPAGYGAAKIDIVVKLKSDITFYEIKTYNSIKTSIREAFGQLMEYCFYPDQRKATELIIVTQLPADLYTKAYFKHLRDIFKLKLYYQSFNLETKSLSEKY